MTRTFLPAIALAMALPAMAAAQDAPRMTPSRDVAVTYRITADGGPQSVRWSWLTGQQLMRMDVDGGPGWLLLNMRDQSAVMVMEAQRMAMRLPREQAAMMHPDSLRAGARFTRVGTATVAGVGCTTWRVDSPEGSGEACITEDGVLLRGRGGQGQGQLEATEVRYGGLDAGRFRVPDGIRVMEMPAGVPGGAPPRR